MSEFTCAVCSLTLLPRRNPHWQEITIVSMTQQELLNTPGFTLSLSVSKILQLRVDETVFKPQAISQKHILTNPSVFDAWLVVFFSRQER